MVDFHNVEAALTHLLASCWADRPADAFGLSGWQEYYRRAEFATADGSCSLALENEVDTPLVRATYLQGENRATEWLLVLANGAVLAVERGDGKQLADMAWRMLRSIAEGAATARAIETV